MLTGGIFLAGWFRVYSRGWPLSLLFVFCFLFSLLIVITLVDIRHSIIPNQVILSGIVAAFGFAAFFPETHTYSFLETSNYYLAGFKPITYHVTNLLTTKLSGSVSEIIWIVISDLFLGAVVGGGTLLLTSEFGKIRNLKDEDGRDIRRVHYGSDYDLQKLFYKTNLVH